MKRSFSRLFALRSVRGAMAPAERGDEYERCALCGGSTGVRRDAPVGTRRGYVDGAGQLCPECWQSVYACKDYA